MAHVVIVQRKRTDSLRYALWLLRQGHTHAFCDGPSALPNQCKYRQRGSCPLWESGDLLIYDPWLDKDLHEASSEALVCSLREHYPDTPLILIGPQEVTPTWVDHLARQDALVRAVFPARPLALADAVQELLAIRGLRPAQDYATALECA